MEFRAEAFVLVKGRDPDGSSLGSPMAVWYYDRLSLFDGAINDLSGYRAGRHANRMASNRVRTVPAYDYVLAQDLYDQLHHGGCYRLSAGSSVRYGLE